MNKKMEEQVKKKISEKFPSTKTLILKVDPAQGAAKLAGSIEPPQGYSFSKMDRKGTKVTITYKRQEGGRT